MQLEKVVGCDSGRIAYEPSPPISTYEPSPPLFPEKQPGQPKVPSDMVLKTMPAFYSAIELFGCAYGAHGVLAERPIDVATGLIIIGLGASVHIATHAVKKALAQNTNQ